jgi:hypothetical protein
MSTTIITSAKAAMSILVALYTEHEAVCDQIEDLTDRGTKSQQRPLPRLIAKAERLAALETKAVELVLALDPSLVDICGVYDTVDEIIDGDTTYGGGK